MTGQGHGGKLPDLDIVRQIKTKEFCQPIDKQVDIVVNAPRLASRTTHEKGVA